MGCGLTKQDSMCLKGIAIWIMMFHHCYMEKERFEGYIVDFSPFPQQVVIDVSSYFKICVSIFVFITGYGLYLSAKGRCPDPVSTERWIWERLVRTLSGFWVVYVLIFVITQIFAGYPAEIYFGKGRVRGSIYALIDLLGLAHLFSTPTMVSTWWYMSAAIVYIILVPVFIKWTEKLGYTTLFCVIMTVPRCVGDGYPSGVGIFTFLSALLLGMMFAQYDIFDRLDKIKGKWVQFIVYHVLLAGSAMIWMRFPRDRVWEYHMGIAPLIAVCYCRKYVVRIPAIRGFLAFCGKHSMNIFLVHSFIRYVFFQDFIYSFRYFGLIVLVLFSISLGISILIEQLKRWTGYTKYIDVLCSKISGVKGETR